MRALQAARHQSARDQNRPPKVLYVFEHKTQYILIHAPHIRTVAFWHISNIPQGFHRLKWTYELIYVVRAAHRWGK